MGAEGLKQFDPYGRHMEEAPRFLDDLVCPTEVLGPNANEGCFLVDRAGKAKFRVLEREPDASVNSPQFAVHVQQRYGDS